MAGNDLHTGNGRVIDPILAWRVALSKAMTLLFNADVEDPFVALQMLQQVQVRNPETFGGMYEDVRSLAEDAWSRGDTETEAVERWR